MANPLTLEDVRERLDAGTCVIRSGETVLLGNGLEAQDLSGCKFESDSSLVFYGEEAPREPPIPAEVSTPDAGVVETPMGLPSLPLALDGGVPDTQAIVAQAQTQLADFSNIPKDPSAMGVVMAAVAVAGGGTAWKFYNDWSKRKHEENMAKIENEKSKSDDHSQCTASRAALELKVTGLESALSNLQASINNLQGSIESMKEAHSSLRASVKEAPDMDELKEKIEEFEKILKAKKGKKA